MSSPTESTSLADNLLTKYFDAWRNHNEIALGDVFESDCVYDLGTGEEIRGLGDVQRYWRRNARRQSKLYLTWRPSQSTPFVRSAVFYARFFDTDENQHQTVSGIINLYISPSSLKVKRLSEVYIKEVVPGGWLNWLPIKPVMGAITSLLNSVARVGRTLWATTFRIVLSIIFAVAAFYLYLQYINVPRWVSVLSTEEFWTQTTIQNILSLSIPAVTDAEAKGGADKLISILKVLLAPAAAAIPVLLAARHFFVKREFEDISLNKRRTDLDVMAAKLGSASRAVIFSGDFDFIASNPDLFQAFQRLNEAGSLHFISYKSKPSVHEKNIGNRDAMGLIQSLESSKRIAYDSGLRMRLSFYEREGRNAVLYKHTSSDGREERAYILSVEERMFAKGLVEAVSVFASKAIQRSDISAGRQGGEGMRPAAIFICGRPKSGKSTLARVFLELGIEVVSASSVLRKHTGCEGNRLDLLQAGHNALNSHGHAWFGERIYDEISSNGVVAFDGIRPLEAVRFLQDRFRSAVIIYLDAPEEVRRNRIETDPDKSISFEDLERHPVEAMTDALAQNADVSLPAVPAEQDRKRFAELILRACRA